MANISAHVLSWFYLETGELIIISAMCLFAVMFVKSILQNAAMAVVFYPLLVASSIVSVGLGRDYGLVGEWTRDTVHFLVASASGMSLITLLVLSCVAIANRT